MDIDPATQMVAMRAAQTQQLVGIAVVKKQHEMETQLIDMLSEVARAAPPPGQGTRVDKVA